ncbi:MAG TPA: DUF2809 domain-containing protein [Microbacterium sp.]|nr:DUF2809 domain-containing protein [Microbacterium sp.]
MTRAPAPAERIVRRRIAAAIGLAAVVGTGLCVHAFLADSAGTDIVGDALYALAAYLAVIIVAPRLSAPAIGAIAAAWCVAVELFQLTGLPNTLAAFPPAMLVLGTVFDPRDLLVYVLTVIAVAGVDTAWRATRSKSEAVRPEGDSLQHP